MPPHAAPSRAASPTPTDLELANDAQSALSWNLLLPVGAIRASAEAGWLTLSGEVRWHHQRQDAQECVRHLAGVVGIHNNITLRTVSTLPCADFKGAPGIRGKRE
jgi:osmotically-inducible protein OsmY